MGFTGWRNPEDDDSPVTSAPLNRTHSDLTVLLAARLRDKGSPSCSGGSRSDRANMIPMRHLLAVIGAHDMAAWEALLDEGHHPKVVLAKMEKAYSKGYTEVGMSPRRPWLTDKGRAFLADAPPP